MVLRTTFSFPYLEKEKGKTVRSRADSVRVAVLDPIALFLFTRVFLARTVSPVNGNGKVALRPKTSMDRVLAKVMQQRIWEMGPGILNDLKKICDIGPEAIAYLREVFTSTETIRMTTRGGAVIESPRFTDDHKLAVVRIWLAAEEMILARTSPTLQAVKLHGEIISGSTGSAFDGVDLQAMHAEALDVIAATSHGQNGRGVH
jgi:hypothetical protein